MKAVVIYKAGGAENLIVEDRLIPDDIVKGEVLIKVKAFGLNRSELMTRKGYSPNVVFPRVLGIECVGEIVEDPSGEYLKGQKIAAFMGGMGRDFDGSYAEYAKLPKSIIFPFESVLDWSVLGALPEMFQTVYGSLFFALKIEQGETILIRGGTSSIGVLAMQIAKKNGLTVIATTRNPDKEEFLRKKGADFVIIDNGEIEKEVKTLFPDGVDKVLELVGASTLKDSLHSTIRFGTVCMTGMLSEQWSIADFAPMEYIPAAVHLTVYDSGQIRVGPEYFQQFIRDIENGEIQIAIKEIVPLEEIVEAHKLMESNVGGGKIVVIAP